MRPLLITLFFLSFISVARAQRAVYNYGNLQLHKKGSIGFHTDLINDGGFDKNLGLVGFYNESGQLSISGTFPPAFYDFEMAVENNLYLDLSIGICNSLNFIYGDIKTTRNNDNVYVELKDRAIYDGEHNSSKIDGNVAVLGQKEFNFPVGYDDILRPLQVRFIDGSFLAKCEYFHENPDNPDSFYESFDIKKRNISLGEIHTQEFWNLTTSGMVQIALNWGEEGSLPSSVSDIESITITGWNKKNKQWDNLGNAVVEGTTNEGLVKSNPFNANDYEIFTLGFLFDLEANKPGNYALTPNGDGINDAFTLKIMEQSPNNLLKIFNKEGRLVYEKTNYQNEFRGFANKNNGRNNQQLSQGVYFYILELKDLNQKYQGYFYLAN
ncbi:MAG: gliding motility-associated C-terminal domain-containing protein [Aurantibacter sp.]